jgi:hypothetical protein
MRLEGCKRESEMKQALESGQWPLGCSGELCAHVATCRSCKEQVLLSTSFRQVRSQSMAAAPLGSPGLLWWRAQLRRRNQAVERVTRPLLGAQIFSLAVMLLAALVFFGIKLGQQQDPLDSLKALPHRLAAYCASLTPSIADQTSSGWLLPLVLLSALALFGGAVIYFSSDRG